MLLFLLNYFFLYMSNSQLPPQFRIFINIQIADNRFHIFKRFMQLHSINVRLFVVMAFQKNLSIGIELVIVIQDEMLILFEQKQ